MTDTPRGTLAPSALGSLSATYSALLAADAFYEVDFLALNTSGVSGGAFLALDAETNELTVITGVTGIEPGQTHIQHIHGFPAADIDARPPTIAQDSDRDGLVEVAEGAATYGPILLNLTEPPGAGLAGFPRPSTDSFVFVETYDLDTLTFDANPNDSDAPVALRDILTAANLSTREIVVHGQSLQAGQGSNGGEADGTAGYKLALPVASGDIRQLSAEEASQQIAAGRFELGNQVAAFDVGGNAGQVYRLYDLFDRAPDVVGSSFWVEQLDEGGNLGAIASGFLFSAEFTSRFGAVDSLTNEQYVDALYLGVLERSADADGRAFFVDALDEGTSRESILISFTESVENQAQNATVLRNGILLDDSILV